MIVKKGDRIETAQVGAFNLLTGNLISCGHWTRFPRRGHASPPRPPRRVELQGHEQFLLHRLQLRDIPSHRARATLEAVLITQPLVPIFAPKQAIWACISGEPLRWWLGGPAVEPVKYGVR